MKQNFRLVTLDYPKLILDEPGPKQAFIDMIQSKQRNFQRTSENYVTLNSLDMVSTHVMIYDVTHIYHPKPVLAIRVCYRKRATKHGLALPSDDYFRALPPDSLKKFEAFSSSKTDLIDCNAWFVDPDYTFSKTKIALSDMGFFAVAMFILRRGNDHLVGCSNEQYKASRWVNDIGHLIEPVTFIHPKVPTPHQLVILDGFRRDWLTKCAANYADLISNANEFMPTEVQSGEKILSSAEVLDQIRGSEQFYDSAA